MCSSCRTNVRESLYEFRRTRLEDQIANFEETADCEGNWIRASIAPDGKFTITNGGNGFSKTYAAR